MTRALARLLLAGVLSAAAAGAAAAGDGPSTADHSQFEALQGPFDSGPEVTRACLECHTEAAKQVHGSIHWSWETTHPETGQQLGKRHVLNNFCTNVRTNEPRCTSCHVGYGWDDGGFDFSAEDRVDCLVCHDTTGTYAKAPKRAGRVLEATTTVHGKTLTPPDLGKVARNVGAPTLESCGGCHFGGGGGDGSKHGDLDSSLLDAPKALDVHMSEAGAGLVCTDCHVARGHELAGSRYDMVARDRKGTGTPGQRRHAATCESCHGTDPHSAGTFVQRTLNAHADRVACQTCHIPEIARGGVATKVWWDWSKAGRQGPDGGRIHETNAEGRTTYWTRWGEIRWDQDFAPSYAWFDGDLRYTEPTDEIDPGGVVPINRVRGSADDPNARIWPFKVMRGKQPYDPARDRLVLMHLFGRDDTAYWTNLDWRPAIRTAMAAEGLPYSGELGFVETKMSWPVSHMVAPAEDALSCGACHAQDGRMAGLSGAYLPGRDTVPLLDKIGRLALLATLAGVLGHAGLRVAFHFRRRMRQ